MTFVDSDDRLPQGAFEALMETAYAENADIVYGAYNNFNEKGIINSIYPTKLTGFPWGKVFRANLFERVQFPESFWFEDTVCSLVIFPMAKKIQSINVLVYDYRYNLEGISRTSKGKIKCLDTIWIMLQMIEDRKAIGIEKAFEIEQLCAQLKLNARRVHSIGNEKADLANFLISRDLLFDMCINYSSFSKVDRYMIDALKRGDFNSYMVASLLGK